MEEGLFQFVEGAELAAIEVAQAEVLFRKTFDRRNRLFLHSAWRNGYEQQSEDRLVKALDVRARAARDADAVTCVRKAVQHR